MSIPAESIRRPSTPQVFPVTEQALHAEGQRAVADRQRLNAWRLSEQSDIGTLIALLKEKACQPSTALEKRQVAVNELKNKLHKALQLTYDLFADGAVPGTAMLRLRLHQQYAKALSRLLGKPAEYQWLFSTESANASLITTTLGIQPGLLLANSYEMQQKMPSRMTEEERRRKTFLYVLKKCVSAVCNTIDGMCSHDLACYPKLLPVIQAAAQSIADYCETHKVTPAELLITMNEMNLESTLVNTGHSSEPRVMLRKHLYTRLFGIYATLELTEAIEYVKTRRRERSNENCVLGVI